MESQGHTEEDRISMEAETQAVWIPVVQAQPEPN